MYFIIIGCVFLFGTGILMYAMCCASGKTNRTENDLEQEFYDRQKEEIELEEV